MNDNNFVKLGDVAHECRLTWSGEQTNIPIVGLEHLIPGEIELSSWDRNIEHTFSKKFTKGQVLLGRRRVYLKKAVVAPCDGICSGDITVIESTGGILPELLPFVIQNDRFFDYAMQGSAGSLSPRVKWEHLKNYEFSLPSLAEQKVLADKLWTAYRLKESYKKLLTATEEMVKSQFIEVFKHKKPNGKIADLVDANIKSVKKSFNKEDMIEYIDISSVNAKYRTLNETTQYIVASAPSRAQQCVQNGDILVSTVRPINRNVAVVNSNLTNLVASTGFCVLRPIDGYMEYLLAIVTSDKYTEKMCDIASGGLYPAVNNSDVLSYDIFIPDKDFLHRVTQIYQQADKSGFELRKSIEAIDQVIKSLINNK